MRRYVIWIFIAILLGGCISSATPTPSPTSTATILAPTITVSPPPTATSLPAGMTVYYHIRIEYSTTSDWSTLDLRTTEHILAMRALIIIGEQVNPETNVGHLALNQSLESAQAGKGISMKVDYAIAPEALNQPLRFHLQKGTLNGSMVRVYQIVEGKEKLVEKIEHQGMVQKDPELNPLDFLIDLSPLKENPPLVAQVHTQGLNKMVWAFYYSWYHMNDWTYWLKDHPLARYELGSRDIILQHVEQAQSAGIDGFISSWWGPGSETDDNLKKLLEIAEARNFQVTIYLETMAGPNETPLSEKKIYEWLAYAIREYRDDPAFFKVDDKPLIVIWASSAVPLETWGRVFAQLRTEGLDAVYLGMGYNLSNLEVFDGLHDYNAFTHPDLEQTLLSTASAVRNYALLADNATPKIWVATVQPGYDDTLSPLARGSSKSGKMGTTIASPGRRPSRAILTGFSSPHGTNGGSIPILNLANCMVTSIYKSPLITQKCGRENRIPFIGSQKIYCRVCGWILCYTE